MWNDLLLARNLFLNKLGFYVIAVKSVMRNWQTLKEKNRDFVLRFNNVWRLFFYSDATNTFFSILKHTYLFFQGEKKMKTCKKVPFLMFYHTIVLAKNDKVYFRIINFLKLSFRLNKKPLENLCKDVWKRAIFLQR